MNNGGEGYKDKEKSQKIFLDFLEEPEDSVRRHREGLYGSFTFGKPGQQVKLIILDTRYFRGDPYTTGGGISHSIRLLLESFELGRYFRKGTMGLARR